MFESLGVQNNTKVMFNIIGEDIVRVGIIDFGNSEVRTTVKSYSFSDINIIA